MRQVRIYGAPKPPSHMPRWLRPKLKPDQVRDLALAHVVNLDAISRGEADEEILWQWVGGALTWSKVAELLELGEPEMAAQLALVDVIVDRYRRTGRVLFTGTEYQLAKDGLDVMDQLAKIVDRATAIAAAEWSEQRVQALAAGCSDLRARAA